MNSMHRNGQQKTKHQSVNKSVLLGLILSSILMGCASGTTKTEESWKFDEAQIQAVKTKCTGVFDEASGGTFDALWANKRLILRRSRDCSEAARVLAEQAENRNKVIGN